VSVRSAAITLRLTEGPHQERRKAVHVPLSMRSIGPSGFHDRSGSVLPFPFSYAAAVFWEAVDFFFLTVSFRFGVAFADVLRFPLPVVDLLFFVFVDVAIAFSPRFNCFYWCYIF
jgi:hypothetical protein